MTDRILRLLSDRFQSDKRLVKRGRTLESMGEQKDSLVPHVLAELNGIENLSAFDLTAERYDLTLTVTAKGTAVGKIHQLLEALRRVFDDQRLSGAGITVDLLFSGSDHPRPIEGSVGTYEATLSYDLFASVEPSFVESMN